jgi:hypothetical protein
VGLIYLTLLAMRGGGRGEPTREPLNPSDQAATVELPES